jgi:hypothetical protein
MKSMLKKLVSGLMLVLSLADVAKAGDSYSIPVSCTIPTIPGINAPLIKEESLRQSTGLTVQETVNTAIRQDEIMKKGDNTEQFLLAEKESTRGIVKTVYSR